MAALKLLLLVLVCFVQLGVSQERFVRSADSTVCPGDPCMTLEEYITNGMYITTNSTFIFLPGQHVSSTPLLLENVDNITLTGIMGSVEVFLQPAASIAILDSENIVVDSMKIQHRINSDELAALLVNGSTLTVRDVEFVGMDLGTHSQSLAASNSEVHVSNCSFAFGNGSVGGAIRLFQSTVTFSLNSTFTNNVADESGGAIFITNSTVLFEDKATFIGNKVAAIEGITPGGSAVSANSLSLVEFRGESIFVDNGPLNPGNFMVGGGINLDKSRLVMLRNANFRNNSATYGGAIRATNSSVSLNGTMTFSENHIGGVFSFLDSSCSCYGEMNFTNNNISSPGGFAGVFFLASSMLFLSGDFKIVNSVSIDGVGGAVLGFNSSLKWEGSVELVNNTALGGLGGAIFLDTSKLEHRGELSIIGNTAPIRGGGIYALESTIKLSGTVNLESNRANEGGGISLENSILILDSMVHVNMRSNQADLTGGAIHFKDSNTIAQCQNVLVERPNCFFVIENLTNSGDISFNFTDNSATQGGSVLYGGVLELCRVRVNGRQITSDSISFIAGVSSFSGNTPKNSIFTSDPLRVCLCSNGIPICSDIQNPISLQPGQTFDLSVLSVGQGNMAVASTVRGFIADDNNSNFTELSPQSHTVDLTCTDITFRLFSEVGNRTLVLFPDGPCGSAATTIQELQISVQPCSPGFQAVSGRCECEQRLLDLNENAVCDVDTGLIQRPGDSWIGPMFDDNGEYLGFLYHRRCLLGYCMEETDETEMPILLNFSSMDNDNQCASNRSGVLCGSCKPGFSLVLQSLRCEICDNSFLSLLIFFAVAGVGLVVILMLLHMTVAAGTINGLILYANIVNIFSSSFLPDQKSTGVLTVFIAWLSLDLGIETCFYNGLDAYAYAWLQYIFPVYLWFLIALIIFINRLSTKVNKFFGSNPVAVLATIFLMSYTKVLQNTILSLSFTNIELPDGSIRRVWLYDGNITYFTGRHIILALFAAFTGLFLTVPFSLLLLFEYRLQATSNKKLLTWVNKFKPLFDTYYGPYNKQSRYWPGLMILVRSALSLVYSLSPADTGLTGIIIIFSLVVGVPWLNKRLYENFYNDVLEFSFIANLLIYTGVTNFIIFIFPQGSQAVLSYISIGIAYLEFVGIVMFHIYLRTKNTRLSIWLFRVEKRMMAMFKQQDSRAVQRPHQSAPSQSELELGWRESLLVV